MLTSGYIKLHRKIINWEWYKNVNTFRVFLHLLLTANYEDKELRGRIIKRGQRMISVAKLADELQLTIQQTKTTLKNLQSTNDITIETTPNYSIISIKNYNLYQQLTNETTNKSTKVSTKVATNKLTTMKEIKEIKKYKKEREGTLIPHGEFKNVFLTESEFAQLQKRFPKHFEQKIERLSRYLTNNKKHYSNHYAVLIDWLEKDTPSKSVSDKASYDISELEKINTLDFIE